MLFHILRQAWCNLVFVCAAPEDSIIAKMWWRPVHLLMRVYSDWN